MILLAVRTQAFFFLFLYLFKDFSKKKKKCSHQEVVVFGPFRAFRRPSDSRIEGNLSKPSKTREGKEGGEAGGYSCHARP